jgi:hypothetical protein
MVYFLRRFLDCRVLVILTSLSLQYLYSDLAHSFEISCESSDIAALRDQIELGKAEVISFSQLIDDRDVVAKVFIVQEELESLHQKTASEKNCQRLRDRSSNLSRSIANLASSTKPEVFPGLEIARSHLLKILYLIVDQTQKLREIALQEGFCTEIKDRFGRKFLTIYDETKQYTPGYADAIGAYYLGQYNECVVSYQAGVCGRPKDGRVLPKTELNQITSNKNCVLTANPVQPEIVWLRAINARLTQMPQAPQAHLTEFGATPDSNAEAVCTVEMAMGLKSIFYGMGCSTVKGKVLKGCLHYDSQRSLGYLACVYPY